MMKNFLRFFAVLSVLLLSQIGQIGAQSNALAITPRKDYTLKPSESVSDTLIVTNRNTNEPLNLSLEVVDFTSQDETGSPQLLRGQGERTAWSLRNYIQIPDQINIGPNETVRIPISIEMPSEAGAGSYYSAIVYRAINELEENRLNVSASGVTLMFVKVPGQAKQQLTFEQFGAFQPDEQGTGGSFAGLYFNDRPKVMAYRLKNEGNVAEQPNAGIVIRNSTGKTVYTISDANPKKQLALRGQIRRFDACIVPENVQQTTDTGVEVDAVICGDTNFAPGRYTAELTVLYGENGNETREITAKASFWYLPWWFLGLVTLGLLILAGIVTYIVRRVKDMRSRKTRRR